MRSNEKRISEEQIKTKTKHIIDSYIKLLIMEIEGGQMNTKISY